MQVYTGEAAEEAAAVFREAGELPEGWSVIEGEGEYIAVANPDPTVVRPEAEGFYKLEEAEEWLSEMYERYQRDYWRGDIPHYEL